MRAGFWQRATGKNSPNTPISLKTAAAFIAATNSIAAWTRPWHSGQAKQMLVHVLGPEPAEPTDSVFLHFRLGRVAHRNHDSRFRCGTGRAGSTSPGRQIAYSGAIEATRTAETARLASGTPDCL
jgi:hypothetical protein